MGSIPHLESTCGVLSLLPAQDDAQAAHHKKETTLAVGRPPQEEEGAFPSPSFLYGSGFT